MAEVSNLLNIDALMTQAIALMGSAVAVAVGGYFAFLVIRKALVWARSGMGDYERYNPDNDDDMPHEITEEEKAAYEAEVKRWHPD